MPYISKESVTYTPEGGDAVELCAFGGLVEEQVALEPSVLIQRDAVYRRPWIRQAARGGASLTMSVTTAHAFETRAAAEAFGISIQRTLLLHPAGTLVHRYAYADDFNPSPGRSDTYIATVDAVRPYPINSDHLYGDTYAPGQPVWLAVAYQLTLTMVAAAPAVMTYANDPTDATMAMTREPAGLEVGFWADSQFILRGGAFSHPYRLKTFRKLALHPTGPMVVTRANGAELCRATLWVEDGELTVNTLGPYKTYTVYMTQSDDAVAAGEDIYLTFPQDANGHPDYLVTASRNTASGSAFVVYTPSLGYGLPICGQIDATDLSSSN